MKIEILTSNGELRIYFEQKRQNLDVYKLKSELFFDWTKSSSNISMNLGTNSVFLKFKLDTALFNNGSSIDTVETFTTITQVLIAFA